MITTENVKVKGKEKSNNSFIWSHALATGGGFMLIQATVASYFSLFMTDVFGVPAAALSVIVFIATCWDAINDPIMGAIADRTHTRWGRYRPYFILFPALLAIVSYFLFLAPSGLSDIQKVIYTAVFYILYGMLTTVCTMPLSAVLPAHTKYDNERNKAVTLGIIFVAISFTIASSFTITFTEILGSYANLMIIYGVLAIIPFLLLFKTSKERYLVPTGKRSAKQDLKMLLKRKELGSVLVVWCMASLGYGIMFSASTYYMLYYIARPDLIGQYMLTISMGALFSMIIAMPICLKIFKTAQATLKFTQVISIICYGLLFFFGRNLTMLFVLSFIAAFFASMQQGLINILLNDTIDYIQLKDGISLNGTLSAVKGFAYKCGTTVSSTVILAVLAATGYVAGAIGHQPEATLIGINTLRFLIPIIASIIMILCLIIYPIEKHYDEIDEMKKNM